MTRNFPKNNPTIRNEDYILPGEPAYQLSKYIRDYKIRKEGGYYNIYAMTFYGEWEKVSGIKVSKGNAVLIETLRNKGKHHVLSKIHLLSNISTEHGAALDRTATAVLQLSRSCLLNIFRLR